MITFRIDLSFPDPLLIRFLPSHCPQCLYYRRWPSLYQESLFVDAKYQLKAEGFIEIDRRKGATVCPVSAFSEKYREKLEGELELLSAEASLNGMDREEFLKTCSRIFGQMHPKQTGEV